VQTVVVILGPRLERWLESLPADPPLAVVLGGSVNALSHVRSLGRRGVPVLVIDDKHRPASASRYARSLIVPDIVRDAESWLTALDSIGRRLARPGVLIPTGDREVELVVRNQSALATRFRFLVPALDDAMAILDKATQYRRAAAVGVRVPRSCRVATPEELRAATAELGFPCLVKASSTAGRKALEQKVLIASSAHDLAAVAWRSGDDPGDHADLVVQEIIPGDDTQLYSYLAFWGADGREHSSMTKRKVRQYPMSFGTGSVQETVVEPEVAELSRRLLEEFSYRGIVGVEWKRDERDGAWYLMEINARSGTCNQLAVSAGVDLPWIAYQEIQGTAVPHVASTSTGLRWVNEELDVRAFGERRRRGLITPVGWVRGLAGARSWALWSWRDPRPFLQRTPSLARGLVRAALASPGRTQRGRR
jgi:D-aspartate ligase